MASSRANVVRGQRSLVADVQSSACHDWMRPAGQSLILNLEPALFDVAAWYCLGQTNDVVFAQEIEVSLCVRQRALADTAVAPHRVAGREFDAREDRVVEAVAVPIHQHHATVMGRQLPLELQR